MDWFFQEFQVVFEKWSIINGWNSVWERQNNSGNSKYIDAIWRAVDSIKVDGYKIDDVIQYETTGLEILNTQHINLNFMVVMSK